MDQEFEFTLIECLDALAKGEPLDVILSRYPEDATGLRPLLQTAAELPALRLEPLPSTQAIARRSFLNQAGLLREQAERRRWRLPIRLLAPLAALALLLVLFAQVVAASAAALPGDMLYPIKRTAEDARLLLTTDRDGLSKQIEQERRNEVAALLRTGGTAEVEFAGPIETIGQDSWQIAGLEVRLASGTHIYGTPAPGRRVQVRGQVATGVLTAAAIAVEAGGPPLVSTATPTATRTPTAAATRTATASSTPRPSATPTRTPNPTATPTAVPTMIPTPVPTIAAPPPPPPPTPSLAPILPTTPADDDNDNDDNSGNDDDDNDNDDNSGNDNDDNDDNSGNGNDDNGNDDNGNDDNGNDNSDDNSGNDDNSGSNEGGGDNKGDDKGGGDDKDDGDDKGND
jgi:hypothetical protein